jgi:hypothetical protein
MLLGYFAMHLKHGFVGGTQLAVSPLAAQSLDHFPMTLFEFEVVTAHLL